MKKCPFCAEEIQDEAIKCKHCGEFLDGTYRKRASSGDSLPFVYKTSFLVFSACMVGPLMLPLIWWHPRMSRSWKIGLTVVGLVIFAVLSWMLYGALQRFNEMLPEMESLLKEFGAM